MIKSKAAASELFGWEDFVPKLNDVVINQIKTKFNFDKVYKV